VALIDGDPTTRDTLKLRFECCGYAVTSLNTDRDAIDILAQANPDGVVVGVGLEDTKGLELLHWLRSNSAVQDRPCIALVPAGDGPTGRLTAFQMGADEVLNKPVTPRDVVTCMAALIRRQRRDVDAEVVVVHAGEGLRGSLSDWSVPELCQMLRDGRKSARLAIQTGTLSGHIDFLDGRPEDALIGEQHGEEAFMRLARCTSGRFAIWHGVSPRRQTLSGSLDRLLLDATARELQALGSTPQG
jgi:DNA-binding response OmpR family regulator